MKAIAYSINLIAIIVTIGIGIRSMESFSLGAVGFLLWAVSPYLFADLMIKYVIQYVSILAVGGLSFILAIGGMFLLIDAMFLHPDAQSALAFVVIPMYQWVILLIVALPLYLIEKKYKGQ